ncbi:MAG: dihydroorotase [Halobacteriovoraceae bacterium]|nr:dihydroorotase [Halobacteriovoraceae bacterium]
MELDIIINNGTCVLPDGETKCSVGIKKGKIIFITEDELPHTAKKIIDATGLHVLPGVIDSQVHFREPGATHKEDLETGSKSAVLGGVTTFLEMPNTKPPTTTEGEIAYKVEKAIGRSYSNFGFFIGATENNLNELKKASNYIGCCGIKIFLGSSTGSLLLYDDQKLLEIFENTSLPIAVHSENEQRLQERIDILKNSSNVADHPVWRDVETALSSTKKIIELAKKSGRKIHILHISSADEIKFLKENKDFCTVEVTPQHLTLTAPDCYEQLGTFAQMNPPIRTSEHRDALWEGLKEGTVDVLGSDHAPHTIQEKQMGYPMSPSGMPGVQTILPLMLNFVNEGKISLKKVVELLSENPASLYSLQGKGIIHEGYDADITIVDMNKEVVLSDELMASKSGWTPFKGKKVKGYPTHTIVGGQVAMENGVIVSSPHGRPIKRSEE